MLIVTNRAAQELRHVLETSATEPGQVLRIEDAQDGLSLELGWEEEGDDVVQNEGSTLLHVSPEVNQTLAGVDLVIDCIDTPDGPQLAVFSGQEGCEDEGDGCCGCDGESAEDEGAAGCCGCDGESAEDEGAAGCCGCDSELAEDEDAVCDCGCGGDELQAG
ncbi:MAG: hypothetical protein NTU41_06690 [Chloroflexi bacterium]|nr:hypothetical protein [Chloroflexota bacterium]